MFSRSLTLSVALLVVALPGWLGQERTYAASTVSEEQLDKDLETGPDSRENTWIFLAFAAGLVEPDDTMDDVYVNRVIRSLDRTAINRWDTDVTNVLLGLRGRVVNIEEPNTESLALSTALANAMRKNGKGTTDLSLCMLVDRPCNRTPFTEDELELALGVGKPTAAMNPARAYHLNQKSAVVFGFISADLHPDEYTWSDPQGKRMTLSQTVQEMLKDTPRDVIVNRAKLCLASKTPDDLATCTSMGIRLRLTANYRR